MNFTKAYIQAWKGLFKSWKMWGVLYLINLLVALAAAIPAYGFLSAQTGQSLAYNKLLEGFDYTVISDFMHQYGDVLNIFINQSVFIVGLFWLVYVFFNGGIIYIFLKLPESFTFQRFWGNSGRYFWRMLRLSFYFLVFHGIVFTLFYFLFQNLTHGGSTDHLVSELEWLNTLKVMVPVYLLFATLIALLHDYAKVMVVYQNEKWLKQPILGAVRFVKKHLPQAFLLYLLNLLIFLAALGIYFVINRAIPGNSTGNLLVLLLIGQLFIFVRVGMKLVNMGSAVNLYCIYNPHTENPTN